MVLCISLCVRSSFNRSRNVVILCDKMNESINIAQSNNVTMAVANQVPPIKLKVLPNQTETSEILLHSCHLEALFCVRIVKQRRA